MRFRPCIDIHDGKVKQMVGGTLTDSGGVENFTSERGAAYYAALYQADNLSGGHVIVLNAPDSPFASAGIEQAKEALTVYPGGLQYGGGVTAENARTWIECGASHVIVTGYLFHDGIFDENRLQKLVSIIGKSRLVLDLSCRKRDGAYWIVTDRWQHFTKYCLTTETLEQLSKHCDEFLVHAVDAEGKSAGIEQQLVSLLGRWEGIPVTYAGGISNLEDIRKLDELGQGRLDFTVGSALDLFGGKLAYRDIVSMTKIR